jgi:tripartite-type tricarboxylate transporter receptor subunit TctC
MMGFPEEGQEMKLIMAVVCALAAGAAWAQPYPRKPIQMLIPLQAASAVDNAARLVAARMSENMGQQIVIVNQPGAAGLIGAERVAKAAPDGYLIGGFNDSIMTMLPNLHARLPWDVLRDFEPVSLVVSMEWALVTSPGSPFRSAADVIAAAKAHPGKLNYSSGGNGSPQHVAMELFKSRAGVFITHSPYRGATAAALDAASGQVDIHLSGLPTVAGLVRGGKIKLLGVGSLRRLPQFPDAPTVAESGLPGFEFNSFYAIVAPKGTPRDIVQRLNAEVVKAANAPDVRDKLIAQGFIIKASSPEQLTAQTREQLERYAKLFKTAGIRID